MTTRIIGTLEHLAAPDLTPAVCLGDVQWSTFDGLVLLEFHADRTSRYIATPQQALMLRDELNLLCAELVQAGLLPDTNSGDDQS